MMSTVGSGARAKPAAVCLLLLATSLAEDHTGGGDALAPRLLADVTAAASVGVIKRVLHSPATVVVANAVIM